MRTLSMGLLGFLGLLIAGYVLLCVWLYLTQDRSIFFPQLIGSELQQEYQARRVEIATQGARLEGWWLENPHATTPVVMLYFGGNAEDVLYTAASASRFNAKQILFVNYRGYGRSTGEPGQKALYEDALSIYDYVIGRGIRPEHIVVMGRSLGSSVASMLAATRPVRAAILITPFDSLASVAAKHYALFPVRLLLRHPFPSASWAKQAKVPALMLAGGQDTIVPAAHARKLFEAWSGKKRIHVLAGVGHNDIEAHPDYYRLINQFLAD